MSGVPFFTDAGKFIKDMQAAVDKRDASREIHFDIRDVAVHMMSRYEKRPLNTKLGRGR